jgi:hypothetical protein
MGDQLVARKLRTHRTTKTYNKRIQTSMPRMGFEPTIPAFERAKMVHALDRAATVIGGSFVDPLSYLVAKLVGQLRYLPGWILN